jgi:hypothetical protein
MTMVVAYTYKADIWCPDCIVDEVCKDQGIELWDYDYSSAEIALDIIVEGNPEKFHKDFDRYDEYTFDSDEFPKAVFSTSMESFEYCCCCHGEL